MRLANTQRRGEITVTLAGAGCSLGDIDLLFYATGVTRSRLIEDCYDRSETARHRWRHELISTGVTNQRARGIYERRGWRYLHTTFVVPDDPQQYVIMAKELGAVDE